jgi:hypothetical protein
MWLETSAEVYAVIFARHKKDFSVHSSFTDVDGDGHTFSTGRPEILTEWGFRNSETPLLKIVQTKESKAQKEWDAFFFIYSTAL